MAASLLLLTTFSGPGAEAQKPAPEFKEVYDLIQAHLAGTSETELNRAAVQALISALSPKVALVGSEAENEANAAAPLVSKASLYEGDLAYLRIGRVQDDLAQALRAGMEQLGKTNRFKGLVLDLRFTRGEDYAAAAKAADLFVAKERPLLDWGKGAARSEEKAEVLASPVAVLVNQKTAGAAEALAAVLRATGVALVLGNQTAGQAMIAQDYPLANGQRLRIASAPIRLGDGSAIPAEGLKPDIQVRVTPADERAYFADAFREVGATNIVAGPGQPLTSSVNGTNHARRLRFNEAELVRERKEGFNPEIALSGKDSDTEKPVVRDPVLGRALDVLKGLAVVRASRS